MHIRLSLGIKRIVWSTKIRPPFDRHVRGRRVGSSQDSCFGHASPIATRIVDPSSRDQRRAPVSISISPWLERRQL